MRRLLMLGLLLGLSLLVSGMDFQTFLEHAKKTGITIQQIDQAIVWTGPYGGTIKPTGPLAGKRIGILAACDFSDWQAYYLAAYIGEFGGTPQFILDNNHLWKVSRHLFGSGVPVEPTGRWGLTLTAGLSGMGYIGTRVLPSVLLKEGSGHVADLPVAKPEDYDALIILGGWAGDILYADDVAIDFIKKVVDRGVPIAAIGEGILPLIKLWGCER